jgi:hypothetical protein
MPRVEVLGWFPATCHLILSADRNTIQQVVSARSTLELGQLNGTDCSVDVLATDTWEEHGGFRGGPGLSELSLWRYIVTEPLAPRVGVLAESKAFTLLWHCDLCTLKQVGSERRSYGGQRERA